MMSSIKTVKWLLCLMRHLGLHKFLYICIPHNASELSATRTCQVIGGIANPGQAVVW